jgi:PAS domain S-box-containing protein
MKLQEKTSLILIALLIIVIVIISSFVTIISLSSYRDLERQYVIQDVDQAVNKLNDEFNSMSAIASDWGPWDDTVDFVNGNDPEYLNSNLQPYGFDNLHLNLIVITDRRGDVIFSGVYNLKNKTMVPTPAFFSTSLDLKNPLMNMSDPHKITSGILMAHEGPMLLVSQPIVYSNYSGPAQGVIIMGRNLDSAEVARLAHLTHPSLQFSRITDPALSPSLLATLYADGKKQTDIVTNPDKNTVTGSTIIKDIYGNDALVLQITEPRDIYQQGINTTVQYIFVVLAAGLFLGVVMLFVLDRLVLSRIMDLSRQVSGIGKMRGISERVFVKGDDEFAGLASEINKMLETIDKTQTGLQVNEDRFRALAENSADILFSLDMDDIFTYVSPQINKYGFLVEEISGKPIYDFIHPEDIKRVEHDLVHDLEKSAQFNSTFRILDKWGNVHWMEVKGTLRLDQSGKPLGIYGVLRDDSERRKAEDALTELKNLYMAIFDNTGSAMIILTSDTSIVLSNAEWVSLTGVSRDDTLGKSFTSFVHPEDRSIINMYHIQRRTDPSNVPREYTFRLIDSQQNIHHCLVSVVMIPGTNNSIAAIIDITERKRAEDAIELANKKLNLMNNITRHDILNTITGLLGCVDMAKATSSSEEKMQLLDDIKDLTRIIQRQIAFTKEYQEVGVHLPLWQNLNGVMTRVLQNFSNSGLEVHVELENTEIYADPLLEKVFYNLVDNAIRYGESITLIKFYFQISDMGLSIICEDNGTGIISEEKMRIFERGVGRNTGMGLFLTREILGITGITIVENGIYGLGARFEMLIPRGTFRFVR